MTAQGTNRWFLWFAPKAAHAPLLKPPNELHSYDWLPDLPPANSALARQYYQAMIEALDTEMGRLLTSINLAETLVVFLGDNGTSIARSNASKERSHEQSATTRPEALELLQHPT